MTAEITGLVVMTLVLEHICRLIRKYGVKLRTAVNFAAEEGNITAAQRDQFLLFVDTANIYCDIARKITGY